MIMPPIRLRNDPVMAAPLDHAWAREEEEQEEKKEEDKRRKKRRKQRHTLRFKGSMKIFQA